MIWSVLVLIALSCAPVTVVSSSAMVVGIVGVPLRSLYAQLVATVARVTE